MRKFQMKSNWSDDKSRNQECQNLLVTKST